MSQSDHSLWDYNPAERCWESRGEATEQGARAYIQDRIESGRDTVWLAVGLPDGSMVYAVWWEFCRLMGRPTCNNRSDR